MRGSPLHIYIQCPAICESSWKEGKHRGRAMLHIITPADKSAHCNMTEKDEK